VSSETRFAILERTDPERAANLAELAQADADERWRYYQQLASIHRVVPHVHHDNGDAAADAEALAAAGIDGKEDLA
jgi:pyruvate-ferredoxin/flavodoxin oxidoreductase